MSRIIESEFVNLVDTGARYDELAPKKVTETNPGFYIFSKKQILEVTTPAYRQFLKEAGYAEIDNCSRLEIGKGLLKWSDETRNIAEKINLNYKNKKLSEKNGEPIFLINQSNGIKLLENIGYNLLTSKLMHRLFLPYIFENELENEDASRTMEELLHYGAGEWLEDKVIDRNKLIIRNKEMEIDLPKSIGKFDIKDLNEWGYPNKLGDNGYDYNPPKRKKTAALCSWAGGDLLTLFYSPSFSDETLGIRPCRFVMEKKNEQDC